MKKVILSIGFFALMSFMTTRISAQVTIGADQAPHASALLELTEGLTTTKGFLGPRVSLMSVTDQTTIPGPARGLFVYNLGDGGLTYEGYVYWNGTEWKSFTSGSMAPGTIGAITCNAVQLVPAFYTSGTYYTGTMNIPYTGGNGGVYSGMVIGPVNGLTATLSGGNFANGAGTLSFTVEGTPTITSPVTTVFPITIGGQSCNATVGEGDGIAPGDLVFYCSPDFPANTYNYLLSDIDPVNIPVMGGKLRVDFHLSGNSTQGQGGVTGNPRLYNVSGSNVKFWFASMTSVDKLNAANLVLQPGNYAELDNGIYYNRGVNQTLTNPHSGNYTSNANDSNEIVTLDLSLDNKWYRIYYFPVVDNMNQGNTSLFVRRIFISVQRLY